MERPIVLHPHWRDYTDNGKGKITMQLTRRQVLGAGLGLAVGTAARTSGAAAVAPKPSVGSGTIASQLNPSLAAYSFRQYLPRVERNKTGTMTLGDLFDLAAVWRLSAIEPTAYYFTSEDKAYIHALKAKAFRLGLDISGTAVGNNFCLPPGEERNAQIGYVKRWVDNAVELGAPVIRVFAGRKNDAIERERAFTYAMDCMKECCDYAGSRGVFLAIENHGYLTEQADDVLKVLDTVNNEWFGINLDTGNFDDHPYRDMAVMAPKAINVQVKAMLPTEDGSGEEEADFARIICILRDANYRGYVALEYEEEEDAMTAVPRYLDKLREAIAS